MKAKVRNSHFKRKISAINVHMLCRVFVIVLVLAVASVSLTQAVLVSNEAGFTPSQNYSDPQVTYTITLKGADKTTLSIDGGKGVEFSKTTSVTLDGSKPHQFQVSQVICQSGWECRDQVTDWRKGMKLSVNQWTWTVPAGTVETSTYTETYYDQYFVCTSYDSHGSCVSGYYVNVPYTQTYTQSRFTPPCSPCKHTFDYTTQYRLVIEDKHSSTRVEWYDAGTTVPLVLSHDATVAGASGVRDIFQSWAIDAAGSTDTQVVMNAPHLATATYQTQYFLDVTSPCTCLNPSGGGWYNDGQTATISIENQAPMDNWEGSVGGKYVFDGWVGLSGSLMSTIASPTAQVMMTGPQSYSASCHADNTIPTVSILIPIMIVGGGYYYYWRRRKPPPPPVVTPPETPVQDQCGECSGLKLRSNPVVCTIRKVSMFEWGLGGKLWGFEIQVVWPGSANQLVKFGVHVEDVEGSSELEPQKIYDQVHVTGRATMGMSGNVNDAPPGLYPITVTATGYTKDGKPCPPILIKVYVHVCDEPVCSEEPFFPKPSWEGSVYVTDANGSSKPPEQPLKPGDTVNTGADGTLQTPIDLTQTLSDLAKNQGVASPTGTGTGTGIIVEPNTGLGWLDPLSRVPVSWLRMPDFEQFMKMAAGGLTIGLSAGKFLLNWRERGENQHATVLLPRPPSEDDYSWAARVNGTRLLVETVKDGSAAAVTVLEDYGKQSAVQVWNTGNPSKIITVNGGEQLTIRAGKADQPVKMNLNPDICRDPFGVLQKWGSLHPASAESLAALTTPTPHGPQPIEINCPRCGRIVPPAQAFCIYCGTNMSPPRKQPSEMPEPPGQKLTQPCPNCGRNIPPNLKFCTYCGKRVEPRREPPRPEPKAEFCVNCGKEIAAGKKFCIYCGSPQNKPVAEPARRAKQGAMAELECKRCGEPIRPGKKFCMKCGTAVSGA